MQERLRVDNAAVQTMASGWGALVSELNAVVRPAQLGLPYQSSAAAVRAAHADAQAFTQALAAQVGVRAGEALQAGQSYLVNEAISADELSAAEV